MRGDVDATAKETVQSCVPVIIALNLLQVCIVLENIFYFDEGHEFATLARRAYIIFYINHNYKVYYIITKCITSALRCIKMHSV